MTPDAVTRDAALGGEQPSGAVSFTLRVTKPDGTTQDTDCIGLISSARLVMEGRVPTDPPPPLRD